MLYNYLKTTCRHLLANKVNTSFKVGGLTLAFFSLLVILLFVSYQLSFDRFHQDAKRIYRVNGIRNEDGKMVSYAMVPPALGPALKAELPEVEAFTRVGIPERCLIKYKDKMLRPNGFVDADSSFFGVFSVNFVQGDHRSLSHPASIILTQSLAVQIFGDEDPMGQPLSFTDRFGRILTVTAVIEDLPANAHLEIRAIMSRNALDDDAENLQNNSWNIDAIASLYVKVHGDADISGFSERVMPIVRENLITLDDDSEQHFSAFLQPITEIYLSAPLNMEFCRKGNVLYVYLFALLGIFILIVANINYVNLSVAAFSPVERARWA